MFFPALGALAAMWLLVSPYLGLEVGTRALLAVTLGMATLILAPLGVWFRPARWAMACVGLVLGFVDLAAFGSIGSLASLGTCAVLIILGGIAPEPVVTVTRSEARAPSPIVRADRRPPVSSAAHPAANARAA
jgi:hypothetical protein